MLCTGFPYDVREGADDILNFLEGFLRTAQAIRRDGSAALDLCYVAMGRFDGFWEMRLKPWDIAAGALIVQEAGGSATGFDNALLDLKRGDVLASNLLIHDELINVIRRGSFKKCSLPTSVSRKERVRAMQIQEYSSEI